MAIRQGSGMTPEERDRLKTLEVNQKLMLADIHGIRKDISDIKSAITRAGGVILGASMIAAAFGWLVASGGSFLKKIGIMS